MSAVLTYGTFPLLFFGLVSGALLALEAGIAPELVVAACSVAAALILAGLERVHPYQAAWNQSRGDVVVDGLHTAVSMVAVPELMRALTFGAVFAVGAWLSATLGLGLWPHHWPLVAQLALALVVGEFGAYWLHRFMHEWAWLWPLHAVHHSAERLYWLNAGRFHPLDTALTYGPQMFPLVLMGIPERVMAAFLVVTAVHGLFQHSNVDVKLGPLNWVFSMTELHRWHHSRTLVESNRNYGANLILWDVVFGTRYLPADRLPPREIGLADASQSGFPRTYLAQLAHPFPAWMRRRVS